MLTGSTYGTHVYGMFVVNFMSGSRKFIANSSLVVGLSVTTEVTEAGAVGCRQSCTLTCRAKAPRSSQTFVILLRQVHASKIHASASQLEGQLLQSEQRAVAAEQAASVAQACHDKAQPQHTRTCMVCLSSISCQVLANSSPVLRSLSAFP